jgi:hypothetical protein
LIRYECAATFSLCNIEMTARNRMSREVSQADMTLSDGVLRRIIFVEHPSGDAHALPRSLHSAAQNDSTCTKRVSQVDKWEVTRVVLRHVDTLASDATTP